MSMIISIDDTDGGSWQLNNRSFAAFAELLPRCCRPVLDEIFIAQAIGGLFLETRIESDAEQEMAFRICDVLIRAVDAVEADPEELIRNLENDDGELASAASKDWLLSCLRELRALLRRFTGNR